MVVVGNQGSGSLGELGGCSGGHWEMGEASSGGRETGEAISGGKETGEVSDGGREMGEASGGCDTTEMEILSDIEDESTVSSDDDTFSDEQAQKCFDDWVVSLPSLDRKMLAVSLSQSLDHI